MNRGELIIRAEALYLWGRDLDREDERVFRCPTSRSEGRGFLGEAQGQPLAKDLEDPFSQLMVSPVLALRGGRSSAGQSLPQSVHEADEDGWERGRSESLAEGEWSQGS